MYIVAIAWLYVVLMMSITQPTILAGISTLVFYGLLPLSIVLYIMGTPQRRRNIARAEAEEAAAAAEASSVPSADAPETPQTADVTSAMAPAEADPVARKVQGGAG